MLHLHRVWEAEVHPCYIKDAKIGQLLSATMYSHPCDLRPFHLTIPSILRPLQFKTIFFWLKGWSENAGSTVYDFHRSSVCANVKHNSFIHHIIVLSALC